MPSALCAKWHTSKLTPFKTPSVTYMAKHHKLTPFKTLMFCTQIDSFQDPVQRTTQNITQFDSFQDPHIGLHSVFNLHGKLPQINSAKSHGRLPSESFIIKSPCTQWNLDSFFWKAEDGTSHATIWLLSRPQDNTFRTVHSDIHQKVTPLRPQDIHSKPFAVTFIKSDSFQDPNTGQGHSYTSSHSNVHTH